MQLQTLGFSSYEARAYLALVRGNPAHGYEVSKKAGVPPAKIYETLNRLKSKGQAPGGSRGRGQIQKHVYGECNTEIFNQ